MDTLSSILTQLDLAAFVGGFAECCAPFGLLDSTPDNACAVHLVLRGSVWARIDDGEAFALDGGDAVFLAGGSRLQLSDQPDRPCLPVDDLVSHAPDPFRMQIGAHGEPSAEQHTCIVFCGSITITESGIYPILEGLPQWLNCPAAPNRSVQAALVACLKAMHERPSTMESLQITHLCQAWFIEVLGLALETDVPVQGAWAGMQDHRLACSLRAIHQQPGTDWSVSQLAALAGLSRPRFAARFAEVVGETPLRYLNRWRVECAAKRLLAGETVTRVAQAMGFANAATFAKVFRRYRDSSPKAWLRATEAQTRVGDAFLVGSGEPAHNPA